MASPLKLALRELYYYVEHSLCISVNLKVFQSVGKRGRLYCMKK
jgi:hypothetical protein